MEPINVTRLVHAGAHVAEVARIRAVKIQKVPTGSTLDTVRVPNLLHYESGCRLHADCFGHYCVTPSGVLLPPQSMSMRNGDIATEYTKAARFAFEGRTDEYMSSLESTNFTKNGTMRSIMSTPVSGSARLIATPNWYRRNIIWISKGLASKINTCYVDVGEDGVVEPVYKERKLEEGDYVMLTRPPPLNIWNTQPMIVRFWNKNCIGVHPETFSAFHGDFDGDEAHIIPLYSLQSLAEIYPTHRYLTYTNPPSLYLTMYLVEQVPRLSGRSRIAANVAVLSDNTKWVIFDTKFLSTTELLMSALDMGVLIGAGKLSRSLVFVYMGGALRLTAKQNLTQAASTEPYAIVVEEPYDIEEVHEALVRFRDQNKEFIEEYNSNANAAV